ncbi:MAG: PIG-L family deacetylase [Candidatus Krumholzibacteria bacterium]|nr:PIG-L family deacetylase [Candidatus Krumholzibacteria bacterium]
MNPFKEKIGTVLCLGAHSDDIEIGCGGTVLKLVAAHPGAEVHWIVFSGDGGRGGEAEASAQRFLADAAKRSVEIHRFRDGFFPYEGAKIKNYFEEIKRRIRPDVVFTHYRHDLHQDHRLVCELTWNTFRSHLILEYEVPKWDGDMGAPNLFVHLDEAVCRRKVEYLREGFPTQGDKHWFDEGLFMGLMRLRGMESNSPTRFAEAFYARKVIW